MKPNNVKPIKENTSECLKYLFKSKKNKIKINCRFPAAAEKAWSIYSREEKRKEDSQGSHTFLYCIEY